LPEGPEVKRIVQRLDGFFRGHTLESVDFYDARYREKQVRDDVADFEASLPARVTAVKCKGKFIWWEFDNGFIIFHTLGMSGTWRIQSKSQKFGKLAFHRADGKTVHYKDFRRFGTFKIFRPEVAADRLNKKLTKELGPDILSEEVTFAEWEQRFRKANKHNITKALMNQRIVSGIGNYIKAEALYRARISPHRTVESLDPDELRRLYEASLWVIKASYRARGATIRNYEMPDGSTGDYTFEFQVFNQREDPHGHTVIRDKTPDGRTTHWVEEIQG